MTWWHDPELWANPGKAHSAEHRVGLKQDHCSSLPDVFDHIDFYQHPIYYIHMR